MVLAATFETIDFVELLVLIGVLIAVLAIAIFCRPNRGSRSSDNEPDTH